MPPWLQQLLDARTVVGFGLGLIAAALAIWLQARVEYSRWLRQQRVDAFTALLAAFDAAERPRARWQLSWDGPDEDASREAFFDKLEVIDHAGGRIQLLSGPDVNRATVRAVRMWTIEINSALKSHDDDRLTRASNLALERYREVLEAARVELRQPRNFLTREALKEFDLADDSSRLVDLPKQLH